MAESVSIVIFGASGDLTHRKLMPSLFSLFRKGRLPEPFRIVGFATSKWTDEKFREEMQRGVSEHAEFKFNQGEWEKFAAHLYYCPGDFTNQGDFENLSRFLSELESRPANRLYYLAVPPRFFTTIVTGLGSAGMVAEEDGWRRVIIEKPFGTDLHSAKILNNSIHQVLSESQIYRIDHYLGKETVQNILVFRFANLIFEPIWNRNYIDDVQITVAESVGLEGRAGYYEKVGVVRDMFQNHLLQLLSLVAMEPPSSFQPDELREEKVKVLRAIRPITVSEVARETVRGQYRGYQEEPGVAAGSQTATFAAMRFFVDNWRWQGVPFYLRSGKKLAEKSSEIIVEFKCPPMTMFPEGPSESVSPNLLALCLQPDEGIHLRFEAKVPDTMAGLRSVDMEFHYKDSFGSISIPDAYEVLLLDALYGDPSLFTRADRAELAWELIDPILAAWKGPEGPPLLVYEPGSWGPGEADELLARDGCAWARSCGGHP
jgi:glucose-6-phosphate 1-dehydrogenase